MRKLKMIIKKEKDQKWFYITKITHLKIMDENWKYIKFIKHNENILDFLQAQEFILDDNFNF